MIKKDTPMNQEQVISTENLMNIDSKYFKINIAYKQKYHFGKDKQLDNVFFQHALKRVF